jgi:pyruvate-formate lyase
MSMLAKTLIDLFGRIEYLFKRLEAYVEIRPTAAMMDIIVKIMVEVLLILGIITKEIKQGRMSMSFPAHNSSKVDVRHLKMLVGWAEIEDSLQRLDGLTQEEARMAAAEILKIARGIDDKVKTVSGKVDCRWEGTDRSYEVRGCRQRATARQ